MAENAVESKGKWCYTTKKHYKKKHMKGCSYD
jgi:hypothetical protein